MRRSGRCLDRGPRGRVDRHPRCLNRHSRARPHGRVNSGRPRAASLFRHGAARPDHQPEQTGENEFVETDGPVEPDHDGINGSGSSTNLVQRPWGSTRGPLATGTVIPKAGDRVSASLFRHGPARPDHQPEQTGENEFGEADGPAEPDHDGINGSGSSTNPVQRPWGSTRGSLATGTVTPRLATACRPPFSSWSGSTGPSA